MHYIDFKKYGLIIAILLAALVFLIPTPGLSYSGHAAIALLVFAVVMWATETVNLAVTSLIILFIQPILGIVTFEKAVIGFANPIIFLMIGGFIMAEAIRQTGLAQRLTYILLEKFGFTSSKALFVIIFATGILSAWIENVVAFAILLPIAKEVIDLMGSEHPEDGGSNFAKAIVLGASFASLAGGFMTEIGTAPNLMAAAYTHIPFASWMIFGVPLSIIMLLIIWKWIQIVFPSEIKGVIGGKSTLDQKLENLGEISYNEKITGGILIFAILLWLTTSFTGINSYSVSLIAAVLFFLFKIIEWKDAQTNVDWGLILFFGGALSLGAALLNTGAANWIIKDILSLVGSNAPVLLITLILMIIAVLITQVMSNIALSAILVPLSVTLAQSQGIGIGTYAVPVAIACSLSFMLPMADPTIAMAYGTKYVSIKEIMKAGIPLMIFGIILTVIIMFTIAQPIIST